VTRETFFFVILTLTLVYVSEITICRYKDLLCVICEPSWVTMSIFHSFEQGTILTVFLISKQAVLYQTRDDTCCPAMSTHMTQSLADSSITNHITWRILIVFTISNLTQITASNLTTVTSHHDVWKTSTLNTPQVKLNIIKMKRFAWHSRLHD
jgi:hypothetical protein